MIVNTIIKHWIIDIGLSKLFDNVITNFHVNTHEKLDVVYKNKIHNALYKILKGYPSEYIHENDIQVIATFVNDICPLTPTARDYVVDILSNKRLS